MKRDLPSGIRRHGGGYQTEVRVVGQPRSVKQWPLESTIEEMQDWRKDEKARLRLASPRATKGTFAADAKRYLTLVTTMPSLKMRTRDIVLWIQVFGTRPRSSITRADIRAQRDIWSTRGPKRIWKKRADGRRGGEWVDVPEPLAPSTVNHRLRALANLYTVLDGRHAPNPARDVPELESAETEERGLPYALIEAIIDALPDRRYGRKLTAEQAAEIRARGNVAGANYSAIGAEFGVSETMVRKIVKGTDRPRSDSLSKTKARLAMIAYTGLSHAELTRLQPHTVSVSGRWVNAGKRRKGKGVLTGRRPLTEQGVAALEAFIAANAFGEFSRDSMASSFRRACEKVIRVLEADPAGAELAAELRRLKVRPYDLRHSFVSEVLEKSGDLRATQLLSGHADLRTTLIYGRRSVNPALRAALDTVHARGGFGGKRTV